MSPASSLEPSLEAVAVRTEDGQKTAAPVKQAQRSAKGPEKPNEASKMQENAEDLAKQVKKQPEPEAADLKPAEPQPTGAAQIWNKVLDQLRRRNVRVEAFARQAVPHFDGTALTLEYTSDWFFHHQKMKEEANEALMREIIKEVAGPSVEYRCLLLKEGEKPSSEATAAKKPAKQGRKLEEACPKPDAGTASKPVEEIKVKDEEKVQKSLDKLKALFSEVEIKIVEE
jgi:hypothetical protein